MPLRALQKGARTARGDDIAPFTDDNPIFRLAGAGRGGGQLPGARDKHAIIDDKP